MAIFTALTAVLTALATEGLAAAAAAVTVTAVAQAAVVVGTTLSVVGAITGDKTLQHIGMGFGAAGAITGLAAAGGLFATETAAEGALGATESASLTEAGALGLNPPGIPIPEAAIQETNLLASSPIPTGETMAAAPGYGGPGTLLTPAPVTGPIPAPPAGLVQQTRLQSAWTPPPPAALGEPPSLGAPSGPPTPIGPPPPAAPTTSSPIPSGFGSEVPTNLNPAPLATQIMNPITPDTDMRNWFSKWFNSQTPAMQAAIVVTGGQAVAGAAGGLFTGMSAEQRLEFDKLVNEQRVRFGSYAPRLAFQGPVGPAGLINATRR